MRLPREALLVFGIVSPLLYLVSDSVASFRYPGYSFLHQTISELNAYGSPVRGLTVVFGISLYLALIAFGVGVWESGPGNRRLRVAAGALVALGLLSLWGVPFASMQVRGVEQGPAHLVAGAVAVLLLLIAMGSAAFAFGARFRRYTAASIAVLLGFGVWAGMDGPRIAEGLATPWVGVTERISVYSYQIWIGVLAATLLRRQEKSPRA